jgi:hypothetical protein
MNQISNSIINLVQQQPWAITEQMLDIINQILYERYFGHINDSGEFDNKFEPKINVVQFDDG